MLQNAMVSTLIISELLRQKNNKTGKITPTPRLGLIFRRPTFYFSVLIITRNWIYINQFIKTFF